MYLAAAAIELGVFLGTFVVEFGAKFESALPLRAKRTSPSVDRRDSGGDDEDDAMQGPGDCNIYCVVYSDYLLRQ